MSEQQAEAEGIDLAAVGGDPFNALMDFLVADEGDKEAGSDGAPAAAPAAGDGPAAPAGQGDQGTGGAAAAPAAGADGKPGVAPGGESPGGAGPDTDTGADAVRGGDLPPEWTASAADLAPKFGEMSTALEENTAKAYHAEALEAVKTEHAKYFEVLETHPRRLIGREVPSMADGAQPGDMETLRDEADAESWKGAVKALLVEEVRDRTSRALEENSAFLTTLHGSIEVLQNNNDLVPYTKDFDRELADRFTKMAEPYELRVEEKLQGWSIPVQPIINQIRSELAASRAAAAPAGGAPNPDQARGADGKFTADDRPQGGIQSKAGAGGEAAEEFSTLFGTLGMPDFRI